MSGVADWCGFGTKVDVCMREELGIFLLGDFLLWLTKWWVWFVRICGAIDEKDAELAERFAFWKYGDFVLGIC
jgi:hypothetical protein